jgi:hypothetical protein
VFRLVLGVEQLQHIADSWRSRPPKRDDVARRNGMMPPAHYEMMPPTGTE